MKLYFARADLLLQKEGNQYVMSMGGKVLQTFRQEKKALSEYNRLRRELEEQLPPTEPTPEQRQQLYAEYIAKHLIGRNLSDKKSKPNKSRTFG